MSKTLKQIRDQVIDDLDLAEQTFITNTDLDRWINQGVKAAEVSIHKLHQEYFQVQQPAVAISTASNLVDYPSDIYANKIKKIMFVEGLNSQTNSHKVKRDRNTERMQNRDTYEDTNTNPLLTWAPTNDATVGRKIRLFPDNSRNGFLWIWYIRNAKVLVLDADICDIDEFEDFIIQFTKTQAYLKDGDPRADDSKVLEQQLKESMDVALEDMTADEDDTEVEMDMSFYDDHIGAG